jgi:hypothetical protein
MIKNDDISIAESDEIVEALRNGGPYVGPHKNLYRQLLNVFDKSSNYVENSTALILLFSFGVSMLMVHMLADAPLLILLAAWLAGYFLSVLLSCLIVGD